MALLNDSFTTSAYATDQQPTLFNTTNSNQTGIIREFRLSCLPSEIKVPYGVFLSLVIILGILGNSLILAVNYRIIHKTVIDVFISGIGTLDIIACIFIVPIRLLELTVSIWSNGSGNVMCKLTRYIAHSMLIASVSILGLIAVERYQKICRNKSFIETASCAKKALAKLLLATSIFTIPSGIYHNSSPEGDQCLLDFTNTFVRIYMFSVCAIYVLLFVLVLSSYSLIALRIQKHTKVFATNISIKFQLNNTNNEYEQLTKPTLPGSTCHEKTQTTPETSSSFTTQDINIGVDQGNHLEKNRDETKSQVEHMQISIIAEQSMLPNTCATVSNFNVINLESKTEIKKRSPTKNDIKGSSNDEGKTLKHTNSPSKGNIQYLAVPSGREKCNKEAGKTSTTSDRSRNNSPTLSFPTPRLPNRSVLLRLKATRILFAVTAVFFISWSPPWITMFIGYSAPENALLIKSPVLLFAIRFYYVSFFINPIIYFLMNQRFRREAKKLFDDIL